MNIKINKNPAGYSAGTFEYIIKDDNGNVWSDGGYHTKEAAEKAAKKHLRKLK